MSAADPAIKDAGYDPNRLTRDQVIFEPYRTVASLAAALARAAVRRELMLSR